MTNNQTVAAALILGLAAGFGGGLIADGVTADSADDLVAIEMEGTWPDVEWPIGSGQMVRAMLDDIRSWAKAEQTGLVLTDPQQKQLNDECQRAIDEANDCETNHHSTSILHCTLVELAYTDATAARLTTDPVLKIEYWSKCADELDHSDP